MTQKHPTLIVDGNQRKKRVLPVFHALSRWASERGQRVAIDKRFADALAKKGQALGDGIEVFETLEEAGRLAPAPGVVVSLGGDGALLRAFGRFFELGLPFLGVNLGTVGFNASVSEERLTQTLEQFERGEAAEVEHMALDVRQVRAGETIARAHALNEVFVQRDPASRMLELRLEQGGKNVFGLLADGLVIASATGSTAYNLSVGGPILHPSIRGVVIAGFGAHTLSARPIVLAPEPELTLHSFSPSGRHCGEALVDGQDGWILKKGDELKIAAAAGPMRLINPPDYDYFANLREKLSWAKPIRPLGT